MELPFTHRPGRRERHLLRRHENPLFGVPPLEVVPEDLLAAQKADHEEMEAFRASFRELVQKAIDLPPNAGSDQVLGLKEELERHYEQSCGLPEDHAGEREAIRKLIGLIGKAVRASAGEDPVAQAELRDEEEARAIHFRVLEQPLVADLLHPDSPIVPDELAASVLDATEPEVAAVLEIFDSNQAALLALQAAELVERLRDRGVDTEVFDGRLEQIQAFLEARGGTGAHPRPQ